jgi:adenosylmethionine-8-amino-7-oxononanoate aminotransferase
MEHSYHGDTIGTMSAGERGVFNAPYQSMLFSVDRLPFPEPGCEQETLDAFEALCRVVMLPRCWSNRWYWEPEACGCTRVPAG